MPRRSTFRKSRNNTNRPRKRGGDAHSAVFSPLVERANTGGKIQSGGGVMFPASFDNVPIRSFYSQNTYQSDPGYLTVAARYTGSFYGGRKRRYKSKSKRAGKKHVQQRGGALFSVPQMPQLRMPVSSVYDSMNPPRESV